MDYYKSSKKAFFAWEKYRASLSKHEEASIKSFHAGWNAAQQSVYLTAFGVGTLAGVISFIIYLVVFLS